MGAPSLDGRSFRAAAPSGGDVDPSTVFSYREEGDLVRARYEGGAIRLGFLAGIRAGNRLEFRYTHVTTGGETAGGTCVSVVSTLPDGRVRLDETWRWESKPGEGTSVLEERAPATGADA